MEKEKEKGDFCLLVSSLFFIFIVRFECSSEMPQASMDLNQLNSDIAVASEHVPPYPPLVFSVPPQHQKRKMAHEDHQDGFIGFCTSPLISSNIQGSSLISSLARQGAEEGSSISHTMDSAVVPSTYATIYPPRPRSSGGTRRERVKTVDAPCSPSCFIASADSNTRGIGGNLNGFPITSQSQQYSLMAHSGLPVAGKDETGWCAVDPRKSPHPPRPAKIVVSRFRPSMHKTVPAMSTLTRLSESAEDGLPLSPLSSGHSLDECVEEIRQGTDFALEINQMQLEEMREKKPWEESFSGSESEVGSSGGPLVQQNTNPPSCADGLEGSDQNSPMCLSSQASFFVVRELEYTPGDTVSGLDGSAGTSKQSVAEKFCELFWNLSGIARGPGFHIIPYLITNEGTGWCPVEVLVASMCLAEQIREGLAASHKGRSTPCMDEPLKEDVSWIALVSIAGKINDNEFSISSLVNWMCKFEDVAGLTRREEASDHVDSEEEKIARVRRRLCEAEWMMWGLLEHDGFVEGAAYLKMWDRLMN